MSAPSPLSVFLPAGFDGRRPVGLLAGRGDYPALTAGRIRAAGVPLRLVAFEGETEPALWESFPPGERKRVKVGQLGRMLQALRDLDCGHALMAGQIAPRRLFHGLHPDLRTLRLLHGLRERNAATIFGAIAAEIEAEGVSLLDARSFLDDQLADEGLMTTGKLRAEPGHIEHGIRVARGIADLDVGQGAVVRRGTVLAVEAYEGTDAMLERAGSFRAGGAVFVKTVKRDQDYRFDVPVFGERTLKKMRDAGIRSAALEAGRVLLLNKEAVLQAAKKYKIELYGYAVTAPPATDQNGRPARHSG